MAWVNLYTGLVSVSDSTPAPGQVITVSFRLYNEGTASSGGFYVGFYLEPTTYGVITSNDIYLGRLYIDNVPPGSYRQETYSVRIPSWVKPNETFAITPLADMDNRVVETTKVDNAADSAPIVISGTTGRPDLTADAVSVSDTTPEAGQTITVNYHIHNNGNAAAGISYAGIYLSDNSTISTGDTLLTSDYVGSISAGGVSYESAQITLPSWVQPGQTYYIGVVADRNSGVIESNESNNASSGVRITIPSPPPPPTGKPDLRPDSVSVSDTTPKAGQTVTVSYHVHNDGNAAAGSSYAGIYLSDNSTISTGDTLLTSDYVGSISAGGVSYESAQITLPSWVQPGQTYYIGVVADRNGNIAESNESNNASTGVKITIPSTPPPPTGKPDLRPDSVSVSDTTPKAGQTVTVSYHVHNDGNAAAGSSYAGIYLSTNSTISTGDTLLTSDYVGSISAGGRSVESVQITLPSWVQPGQTYYIGVVADRNGNVAESNESNNASTGVKITIPSTPPPPTGKPDLISDGVSVSDATPGAGQTLTVNFHVHNQGTGHAGISYAGIYLSTNSIISTGDTLLKTSFVDGISAGGVRYESVQITLPSWVQPGQTYYIGVVADKNGNVAESNESNNASAGVKITIPVFTVGDDNVRLSGGYGPWDALAGNDRVVGTDDAEMILGGDGNDDISGKGGTDTIVGGTGRDVINGGSGGDTLKGDGGLDIISGGSGDDVIYGGDGNDRLYGDAGKDIIYGQDGNDRIFGGKAGDRIYGGRHDDAIAGNKGNDRIWGGVGNDTLSGGNDADILRGEDGNDVLYGNRHGDYLVGGAGNDELWGGGHADIFRFAKGFDTDRVKDFQDGKDKLDLTGWGFGNSSAALIFATQVGSHVKFDFTSIAGAGANDVLWVENITVAALFDDIIV